MKFEQLANIIGPDAALKLSVAWGGERITVPRPAADVVASYVVEQFRNGRDPCCIAGHLSLRVAQVHRILRAAGIRDSECGRVRP